MKYNHRQTCFCSIAKANCFRAYQQTNISTHIHEGEMCLQYRPYSGWGRLNSSDQVLQAHCTNPRASCGSFTAPYEKGKPRRGGRGTEGLLLIYPRMTTWDISIYFPTGGADNISPVGIVSDIMCKPRGGRDGVVQSPFGGEFESPLPAPGMFATTALHRWTIPL